MGLEMSVLDAAEGKTRKNVMTITAIGSEPT
jgi:hypothetical protein